MSEKLLLSLAIGIIKRERSGERIAPDEYEDLLSAAASKEEIDLLKCKLRVAEAVLRNSMERLQGEEKVWPIRKLKA